MTERQNIEMSDEFSKHLSEQMFESSNRPMTNLLVDMETMFDYKLAAILGMIKTDKEFDYITKKLPQYAKYKGRKITTCFPSLKFTEEMVTNFIKDEKNRKYLSSAGLITNITNLIPAQLALFDYVNKNSPLYDNRPINLYFYNELFLPVEETTFQIEKSLKSMFPNIKCHFINRNINNEKEEFLEKMDHLIIDNFKKFVDEKSVTYKMLLQDLKFLGSTISATIQFEEDDAFLESEDDPRTQATNEAMNSFCCFMLFNKKLLNPMKGTK